MKAFLLVTLFTFSFTGHAHMPSSNPQLKQFDCGVLRTVAPLIAPLTHMTFLDVDDSSNYSLIAQIQNELVKNIEASLRNNIADSLYSKKAKQNLNALSFSLREVQAKYNRTKYDYISQGFLIQAQNELISKAIGDFNRQNNALCGF